MVSISGSWEQLAETPELDDEDWGNYDTQPVYVRVRLSYDREKNAQDVNDFIDCHTDEDDRSKLAINRVSARCPYCDKAWLNFYQVHLILECLEGHLEKKHNLDFSSCEQLGKHIPICSSNAFRAMKAFLPDDIVNHVLMKY